jgi:HPt (histidine-containing phosphotransfer) domain-containing protein
MKSSVDAIGRETLALIDPEGSFFARMMEDRARLSAFSQGLQADAMGSSLKEIEVLAHRLAGAAGTFGYPEVGGSAMALEDALLEGPVVPEAGDIDRIRAKIQALTESLNLATNGWQPS